MAFSYFLVNLGVLSAISAVMGWWIKSRLESSIQFEYSRLLEEFRSLQKRSEVLHAERLAAAKSLSKVLQALRRYCHAKSAELRNQSEFELRPESLSPEENMPLLRHHNLINRNMEECELFLGSNAKSCFQSLFQDMNIGFRVEAWSLSGEANIHNQEEIFDKIAAKVNGVLNALYEDLQFAE